MSWEEYKEKHKDQLSDKMGMGIEREQAEYRKQLDEERELRVGPLTIDPEPYEPVATPPRPGS